MKINAGTNYLVASQRSRVTSADRSAATVFDATRTATQSDNIKQADFTSMTRQEIRDWVNAQIRNGEMSLDDSRPFMAMSMKTPVEGGPSGELPAVSDDTRYDFTQKVRDGIQGALLRNDKTTLRMLESATQIMQRYQGQTIGIDIRA
ncbi:hypothetical protein C5O80_31750 [Burkholderia sp. SRS-46]|nr:hypothetical protein C5O80_31750 [Burkholderia sp. SRS-46]